jgi:hypothetical protein
VLGFGDSLVMSFGNITQSRDMEKAYLRFLVKQGIGVKIIDYN